MHYPLDDQLTMVPVVIHSPDTSPDRTTVHVNLHEQPVDRPALPCGGDRSCRTPAAYAETHDGHDWFLACSVHVGQSRCDSCLTAIATEEYTYDGSTGAVCAGCWDSGGFTDADRIAPREATVTALHPEPAGPR